MDEACRPLPFPPAFPVYGWAADVDVPRWLELWNQLSGVGNGPLWQVTLGHGYRSSGPLVYVVTDSKIRRPIGNPEQRSSESRGWPGLDNAALSALLLLIDAMDPKPENKVMDRILALGDRLGETPWLPDHVSVRGAAHACWVLSSHEGWVAVADLSEVAVGVFATGLTLPEFDVDVCHDCFADRGWIA